nr:hypothetical protein 3 [Desulfobacterales bacterium]
MSILEDLYDFDAAYTPNRKKWWKEFSDVIRKFLAEGGTVSGDHYNKRNDTFRRLEMREYVSKRVYVCEDNETGEMVTLDTKEYSKRKSEVTKIYTDKQDTVHVTTILPYWNGLVVMDEEDKSPGNNLSVFRVSSFRDNVPACEATSWMLSLEDPQDDLNKLKSQTRDYMTNLISGGLIVNAAEKDLAETLEQQND